MTGPEIAVALRVILSHAGTTVEAGLADLDPAERKRLTDALRRAER